MGQRFDVSLSCGVGHRRSLDLALLWLWGGPTATTAVHPLAWELPYAMGAAHPPPPKKDQKKKKEIFRAV